MVTVHPVLGKQKSADICNAFAAGVRISGEDASVFWGIDSSNRAAWQRVLDEGRHYYYGDNSYFDETRGTHFRFTRNRLQHTGSGPSDCRRFDALGIRVHPWRNCSGEHEHIVVCPQSDWFMSAVAGYGADWLGDTLRELRKVTERHFRVRPWSSDKVALSRTLPEDLLNAFALVTWSSAAAVTALLNGIPVSSGEDCATSLFSTPLDCIEHPNYSAIDRREWAGVLADNQWTLDELRSGIAWEKLHDR